MKTKITILSAVLVFVCAITIPQSAGAESVKHDDRFAIGTSTKPVRVSEKEVLLVRGVLTGLSGSVGQISVTGIQHRSEKASSTKKEETSITVNSATISVGATITARMKKDATKKISVGDTATFYVKVSTGGSISVDKYVTDSVKKGISDSGKSENASSTKSRKTESEKVEAKGSEKKNETSGEKNKDKKAENKKTNDKSLKTTAEKAKEILKEKNDTSKQKVKDTAEKISSKDKKDSSKKPKGDSSKKDKSN